MPSKTTSADNYQRDSARRNNVLALALQAGWSDLNIIKIERLVDPGNPDCGHWVVTYDDTTEGGGPRRSI